jgi:ZIP family zinc transporter
MALLAGLFMWGMTALGSSTVFLSRYLGRQNHDVILGFAGGVMLAASYWSLLAPAIEMSAGRGVPVWLPPVAGFLLGGAMMSATEYLLPYLHKSLNGGKESHGEPGEAHIKKSNHMLIKKSNLMLILAITVHNIPEGLAVGVAFGALALGYPSATLAGAIGLAIGIGLQNLPEGMAVSLPLRREGMSPGKCFMAGQLSGLVEPAAAVAGAVAVLLVEPVLPYVLAFAAGAMVFVVAEEVIPKAQATPGRATLWLLTGFALMMAMDVGLG